MFLQNILHADSSLKHSADVAVDTGLDCPTDVDNRAVDLLFGRYVYVLTDLNENVNAFDFYFLSLSL